MKKILVLTVLTLLSANAFSQDSKYKYTEACDLTLVGKLMPGKTANPYHRVDTSLYKGFTKGEQTLIMHTSGMACAFKTNSRNIVVKSIYNQRNEVTNGNMITARGYDLYIKRDGQWVWAGSGTNSEKYLEKPVSLVSNMDGSEHECIVYFPLYSELKSIQIGVLKDADIEAVPIPFRHRIAVWGSSFTQGSSTTRSGMTYLAQLSRNTGLQMLSLGTSGRCKMQDYFADVLVDVDADAFLFDTFSNSGADLIKERLVPFIDRMIEAHPGKPMVFQQTIYREQRNFNVKADREQQARIDAAEEIFAKIKSTPEGKKKYKDVYLIHPVVNSDGFDNTVDGVHPDNHGYTLWTKSIEKPLLAILHKYNIK